MHSGRLSQTVANEPKRMVAKAYIRAKLAFDTANEFRRVSPKRFSASDSMASI